MWEGINLVQVFKNEHRGVIAEFVELLIDSFESLDVKVGLTENCVLYEWLNVLIGHSMLLDDSEVQGILECEADFVLFQLEPINASRERGGLSEPYYRLIEQAMEVWDYSEANISLMKELGIASGRFIPLGGCDRLIRIAPATDKPFDVLFCGTVTPRRWSVLERLDRSGCKVHVVNGLYGQKRDQDIARAKIVLNIHQFETSQLEQLRLSYLINNRCFIISESSESDPYGGGVVFCPYEELPSKCMDFLREGAEAERARLADLAYQTLRSMPTRQVLAQAFSSCLEKSRA